MKKLLFLLVFIPLVSFGQFEQEESGQNEFDFNSERSIINYFEKLVLVDQDPMLGIWDSSVDLWNSMETRYEEGARLAVTKNKGKYYFVMIQKGQKGTYPKAEWLGYKKVGDTIAIAEISHSANKLFIKYKDLGSYEQKAKNRVNLNSISGYENVTIIGEAFSEEPWTIIIFVLNGTFCGTLCIPELDCQEAITC